MQQTIKNYYSLTKPRVTYGNVLTTVAGFFLASLALYGSVDWLLLVATTVGTTLIIASACVLNNYLDRDIDSIMERTKQRLTVTGTVKGSRVVTFSIILGLLGLAILIYYTNWLVVSIGLIGFLTYVVLYGMLSKRLSTHGTLVGSISGAMPILAGYSAVSGQIDAGAIIVFVILFAWQFPEFYSIAIYRFKEYKAAGIPLLPIVKGLKRTKIEIFIYSLVFVGASLLLTPLGYTGITYLVVMGALGIYWLYLAGRGFSAKDSDAWARKMFRLSMIGILVLCLMLSVGPILP